jgi:hypothetical protein
MLVSLKAEKSAKSGLTSRQFFGANDTSRTHANTTGISWVHLIAR